MIRKSGFYIALFFIFSTYVGWSQSITLTDSTEKYIEQVREIIKRQNKPVADSIFNEFSFMWTRLNPAQQKLVININQTIANKKYPIYPYYTRLYDVVYHALVTKSLPSNEIDSLLLVTQEVVNKTNKKQVDDFFRIAHNYLAYNIIYKSTTHTIFAEGGHFNFRYINPAPEYEYIESTYEDTYEDNYDEEDNYENYDDENYEYDSYDDNEEEEDDYYVSEEEEPEEDYDPYGYDDEEEPVEALSPEELFDENYIEMEYIEPELPEPKGSILEIYGAKLTFITKYDSLSIENVDSLYYILNTNEIGASGGKMDWSTAGLPEVTGTFKQYKFKTSQLHLFAEGYTMSYPDKTDQPMEGVFEFKSSPRDTITKSKFPLFSSYNANIPIKGFGENIKYKGGFTLAGQNMSSKSLNGARSSVEIYKDGKKRIKAASADFNLQDSTFRASNTQVTLYTNVDSLYHPEMDFIYKINQEQMITYKDKGSHKLRPIIDNYHEIEINVDAINWNLNDTVILFLNPSARNEVPAYFNSIENYQMRDYAQLKGMFKFHPLQMLYFYALEVKTDIFTVEELAKHYKQDEKLIASSMQAMENRGFIDYNEKTGYIRIKEKVKHQVESRRGKTDYDFISIRSVDPGKANAYWHTGNNDLIIKGVKKTSLSDSLNINVFPDEGTLYIRKGRGINFNGKITTNDYSFNGKNFDFNYKSYTVELTNIDSINFTVELVDSVTGEKERVSLDNSLSHSTGTLFIEEPKNHNGLERNAKFPYFDAKRGATVYFNKPDILRGVYDTVVQYTIPPFTADSLGNDIKESVGFDGTFVSGGIFPPIEQRLIMMEDYSFGFHHKVPESGYQLYGGHGKFYGDITLNKQGIRGSGKIVFLNTTIESTDFIFYIDSLSGIGDNVVTVAGTNPEIESTIKFPSLVGYDYLVNWYPKQDSMLLINNAEPFKMYDNETDFNGTAIVTTTGMRGDGIIETEGSMTISPEIAFEERSFTSRKSQFEILTDVAGKPAVRSDYVKISLDFDQRIAKFNPEKKGVATNEFPFLQYKTSLDEGIWDMTERTVKMSVPEGNDISESYFYSTREDQDSIVFNATKAVYSMDSLDLHVEGVPYVIIADAKIIPNNNELYIKENAYIQTIKNAELIIDTVNEFHHLIKGEIDITTKHEFQGFATYQYVNFGLDTFPIQFDKFELVEVKSNKRHTVEKHTVSKGSILENENFYLQPKMLYRGVATMYAQKKNLTLEGYVKLDLRGAVEPPYWMKYDKNEDIDEIRIPLAQQKTEFGEPMITGIHYSFIDNELYSTFLGKKRSTSDATLFTSGGFLKYNDEDQIFHIGPYQSLKEGQFSGNTFSYNEKEEIFNFAGKLNLIKIGDEANVNVAIDFGGTGSNSILDTAYTIKGISKILFDIPPQATSILATEMQKALQYAETEPSIAVTDHDYLNSIAHFIGEQASNKYQQTSLLTVTSLATADKYFSEGFIFNQLELKWHNGEQAWYGHGKVGLGNIDKTNFNLKTNAYIEIKQGNQGSTVNMYLEFDENNWVYFSNEDNALLVASPYDAFDQYIDSKSLQSKNEPKGNYFFATTDQSDVPTFIKRFIITYLDGEGADNIRKFTSPEPAESNDNSTIEELKDDQPEEIEYDDEFSDDNDKDKKKKNKKDKKEEAPEPIKEDNEFTEFVDEFETPKESPIEEVPEKKPKVEEKKIIPADDEFNISPKTEPKPVVKEEKIIEKPKTEPKKVVEEKPVPIKETVKPVVVPIVEDEEFKEEDNEFEEFKEEPKKVVEEKPKPVVKDKKVTEEPKLEPVKVVEEKPKKEEKAIEPEPKKIVEPIVEPTPEPKAPNDEFDDEFDEEFEENFEEDFSDDF